MILLETHEISSEFLEGLLVASINLKKFDTAIVLNSDAYWLPVNSSKSQSSYLKYVPEFDCQIHNARIVKSKSTMLPNPATQGSLI